MIFLSRNTPLAFVVGAAGFLGSHLTDKLLEKSIQVVGLYDLSTGLKENLLDATKSKHFHLLRQSAEMPITMEFPRIDYGFFVMSFDVDDRAFERSFENFLKISKENKSKIILISSIELYDQNKKGFSNLRSAERRLAEFAIENKLNARVVRLSSVFGPRMHFRDEDPMARLIQASISDNLQKETTPLDFTTRNLFVDDAVNLLIKAVMHGATSQKIYDGALLNPMKIAEVRQILLDPLWHENRGFMPTELPPWPTPNLEKTQKELAWKASTSVVVALRKTVSYFREQPELIEKLNDKQEEKRTYDSFKTFVKTEGNADVKERGGKDNVKENTNLTDKGSVVKEKSGNREADKEWIKGAKKFVAGVLIFTLFSYAVIYPFISIVFGIFSLGKDLEDSSQALGLGDFQTAQTEFGNVRSNFEVINGELEVIYSLRNLPFLRPQLEKVEHIQQILTQLVDASNQALIGTGSLMRGIKVVSGEDGNFRQLFNEAEARLVQAEKSYALAGVNLASLKKENWMPKILASRLEELEQKVDFYHQMAGSANNTAFLLRNLIPVSGEKKYLVVLQDNTRIRPGGGVAVSYAEIDFKDGRLVDIQAGDIEGLDKRLMERVEPPAELKKDLGITSWRFKDVSFEPDFPVSAKWMQWFYQKTTDTDIDGVVALNVTALAEIIESVGPVALPESGDEIDHLNIYESEELLPAILKEVIGRIFYLTKQDWLSLAQVLNTSFDQKHLLVYLSDQALLNYLNSLNWAGALPGVEKAAEGEGVYFLALSEANMGASQTIKDIDRSMSLQSNLNEDGKVLQKLTVNYSNNNLNDGAFGVYKNRLRIYLPFGTKITKALWGEQDILNEIGTFTDYGRTGFSVFLELRPKEKKSLILEYQGLTSAQFFNGELSYKQNIIKQPGMEDIPVEYKLHYPASYKLISAFGNPTVPQEVSASINLDKDTLLKAVFTRI